MGDGSIARVNGFLAKLPDGLDSYPDVAVKYSVLGIWTEGHDLEQLRDALPGRVRDLSETGNPVTRWVPEAHATVVYLTLRELFFSSDDAFVHDARQRNTNLQCSPIYELLFRALATSRITRAAPAAYRQVHRGSTLEVSTEGRPWTWSLVLPPHLVPELLARCYATGV